MLRGLRVVRQQLRLTFEASQSRDPQIALACSTEIRGEKLLQFGNQPVDFGRHRIQSHRAKRLAILLWQSAKLEAPHLEVVWITSFLAAAAQEGFSLDASRAFMNQGVEFVRGEHSYVTQAPPT